MEGQEDGMMQDDREAMWTLTEYGGGTAYVWIHNVATVWK